MLDTGNFIHAPDMYAEMGKMLPHVALVHAVLLQEFSNRGDRYVVEQDGVPLAVVVPFALYSQWKRRREAFFQQMRETADQAGLSEDEAIRLTDGAKRAIRSQP